MLFKQIDIKKHLKEKYNYEGKLPVKCHVCECETIYAGHLPAKTLGVKCTNCGLKLGVEYEHYYVGEHKDLDEYDNKLLELAIKIWNKEVKVEDLPLDNKIRCPNPSCNEWLSIEVIKKRKPPWHCNYCNYKIDKEKITSEKE